ncbi:dihydropteroate synthase [Treponema pedis]|uniref:dihydropteroate synthase n=1 Tax=Treponema pedis TaxID=409322 RepID=UPI0003FB27C6|nr:dihydropteroate synthase [Treponema pedis]
MENLKFKCKNKELFGNGETILCGILNVTPDSFSDGGKYFSKETAVSHAKKLIKDGAAILDIGGESTRPGSTPVSAEDEIARVVPVIKAIKKEADIIISVDTWKSEVARASLEAGADIINDITGFAGDKKMPEVIGASDAGVILMFNPVIARPDNEGSKIFPVFGKNEIFTAEDLEALNKLPIEKMMAAYFQKILTVAENNHIPKERIMLDPGIGFGLTKRENLKLISCIEDIHKMGCFSFLGVSRKRFIVNILQENGVDADIKTPEGLENIDYGSAFLTAAASYIGVNVLRVHNVRKHLQAKIIGDAIRLADNSEDIHFKVYGKN